MLSFIFFMLTISFIEKRASFFSGSDVGVAKDVSEPRSERRTAALVDVRVQSCCCLTRGSSS